MEGAPQTQRTTVRPEHRPGGKGVGGESTHTPTLTSWRPSTCLRTSMPPPSHPLLPSLPASLPPHPSIYASVFPLTHPSTHRTLHAHRLRPCGPRRPRPCSSGICLPVHLCFCLLSTRLLSCPSTSRPSVHPPFHPSIHPLSICPSVHPPTNPATRPSSVHKLIYPSTHPPTNPSTRPSSVHLPVRHPFI